VLALMLMLLAVLLLQYTNLSLNVSSVEAFGGIGVYWDEGCTRPVSSIAWGNLSLGQEENVTVYVRNEGNETAFLTELAYDWNPVQASQYINFSWDIHEREIEAGSTIGVTQTLKVSMQTRGISTFGFSINFYGEKIGDIGGGDPPQFFSFDGKVDNEDMALFVQCYRGEAPKQAEPLCDIGGGIPPQLYNCDGKVDGLDWLLLLTLLPQQ
jgi:hypothetical protein